MIKVIPKKRSNLFSILIKYLCQNRRPQNVSQNILRFFTQASFHLIAINRQNCEQLTNSGRCTFPDFTPFSTQLQQMLFAVLGRSTTMFGAQFSLAMNIYVLHICICLVYMYASTTNQSFYPRSHTTIYNTIIFSKETSEVGQTRGVKSYQLVIR
jgi:hypothetical protein